MPNLQPTIETASSSTLGACALNKTRLDMVEACGRLCQILGLPRTTGQIYGLLYMALEPLSLVEIAELLAIKAGASNGTRQLASWGAIKSVWVQGDRRDYYQAIGELDDLIRGAHKDFIKPRLNSSGKRLDEMNRGLEEEYKRGEITQEDYNHCNQRLKDLVRLQRKIQRLSPIAEKFL